jgi:hypothetical protein
VQVSQVVYDVLQHHNDVGKYLFEPRSVRVKGAGSVTTYTLSRAYMDDSNGALTTELFDRDRSSGSTFYRHGVLQSQRILNRRSKKRTSGLNALFLLRSRTTS